MNTTARQLRRRVSGTVRALGENVFGSMINHIADRAKVDPRITYPCYKSFDELIDVAKLKSLDEYLTERIERHRREHEDEPFHTGLLTMERAAPKRPGSKVIYLSRSTHAYKYADLNKPDYWVPTEDAADFPRLMDFIDTLPFKRTARMMIMYDWSGHSVTAHRDHPDTRTCHEFIWFRTNLNKPFYVFNQKTRVKLYVESYSAWFDTVNQFHGADAHPGLSVSIRVDGFFHDELRKQIPVPAYNRASTASLWACAAR